MTHRRAAVDRQHRAGVEDLLRELAPVVERLGVTLRVESIPTDEHEYAVAFNDGRCQVLREEGLHGHDYWAHTIYTGSNDGLLLFLAPCAVAVMRASGLFPGQELPAAPPRSEGAGYFEVRNLGPVLPSENAALGVGEVGALMVMCV